MSAKPYADAGDLAVTSTRVMYVNTGRGRRLKFPLIIVRAVKSRRDGHLYWRRVKSLGRHIPNEWRLRAETTGLPVLVHKYTEPYWVVGSRCRTAEEYTLSQLKEVVSVS